MKLNLSKIKDTVIDISSKVSSPKAFTTYAILGVVTTTVLTIVCTRKQCKHEQKVVENAGDNEVMTREEALDEIKDICKTYAPVAISAVATMFFIKKAEQKWIDLNSMINTAYALSQARLNNYRNYIPATAAVEVLNGLGNRRPEEGKKIFCIHGLTPDDDLVYFESTDADVIWAEYHLNRNFQKRGTASVKEFYAFLNIADRCDRQSGDYFGWDVGIMLEEWGLEFPWIDFDHRTYTDQSGTEVTEIIYIWPAEFSKTGDTLANECEYAPYGLFPTE